ncbi:peptidoglycan recognition protein family protein [Paenibacillus oleatilyticus]|uniref:peptidoglycan recognition protein family protein n=1 Tax=Paenibacillus oleatilyticus TaxID=2594886 RepID=UPI001C1FE3CA|nr:N-acetylmuramoyl-L-alanine amidase [Paenibacillus oleatilyticus]MBU7316171.1 N-acetylmuramoyl-L-alanine amidase [Paenibacillus oleatilyticus]
MFKIKYEIKSKYLTTKTKRRSGIPMNGVRFIVAHDTGNPSSTAINNVNYYERSHNDDFASAHLFVDDKEVYECIPTGMINDMTPEKAWHVVYDTPIDNQLYGCDANDYSIGIEYCYGGKIDAEEAYKRFVWLTAYVCYKYGLNPAKDVTGHHILDPKRKIDPKNGLNLSLGITFEQYIADVVKEYEECKGDDDEMNKVLDYDDWAWTELDKYMGDAYNEGIIEDWKWVQQVRDHTMTYKDLLLLKILIDDRRHKKQ